jgi:8-amino-7-oxononanoate synthase
MSAASSRDGSSSDEPRRLFHVKQSGLGFLRDEIEALRDADLLRAQGDPLPAGAVTFCSNDYLGLAATPFVPKGAPGGAGASRLVLGDRAEHRAAEVAFADFTRRPAALLFPSGYAANVGLLSALAGRGDVVVSDALNHASIVDGARLSRATVKIVPHLDVGAVEAALRERGAHRRAFIVTESYFSMDADSPDLAALTALAARYDAALLVDEAHALGVLGEDGRGLASAPGVHADAITGTLGKAFGAAGAFVAGSQDLYTWLWNRARSFVFTTGSSPALAAHALDNLRRVQSAPHLRANVLERATQLREGLRSVGVTPLGYGPVVPWVLGRPEVALQAAAALREEGVLVQAIRPPTVPPGTARIRFTVTARHSEDDVARLVAAVSRVLPCTRR